MNSAAIYYYCWRIEVWHLLLQERDGVACSMRQCTVLLKDKTPPWDIRNMSDVASWQEIVALVHVYSIHFDTRLDKMDFSAAI